MNNELLTKFAEKTLSYLSNTEVFLKEQIPDYLQQVLIYNYYESITMLILAVIMLLVLPFLIKIIKNTSSEFVAVGLSIICTALFFFSLLTIPCSISTLIKIQFAPKVFLVDYVTKSLKGK